MQKPVMPKRLMLGRVIELFSKETNAGYMWNTPEFCEFHVEKTGATFGSVSYTHLDVYKRQEIGYRSHISQIECSVMSRTVFPY